MKGNKIYQPKHEYHQEQMNSSVVLPKLSKDLLSTRKHKIPYKVYTYALHISFQYRCKNSTLLYLISFCIFLLWFYGIITRLFAVFIALVITNRPLYWLSTFMKSDILDFRNHYSKLIMSLNEVNWMTRIYVEGVHRTFASSSPFCAI